jgi:uncharacterized protein (TIGR02145 family)
MLVYNTNEDTNGGNGTGIYIWKGQWVPVQSLGGSLLCGGAPKITETFSSVVSAARDAEAPELRITTTNPNDAEDPAITYKWQSSTNLEPNGWETASGTATAATYTVPNTKKGVFYYRCVVKNACATTVSGVFTVHITECENFPTVTSNGALARAVKKGEKGDPATLSVTGISNSATPTYQWQRSPDGKAGWTDVSSDGQNSDYKVETSSGGTYYFRCMVSNNCSWVFSEVFKVTVYPCAEAPNITSSEEEIKPNQGDPAPELTVTASGEGTLSYRWQQSTDGKDDNWKDVATGGTSAQYAASTAVTGITYYRCVVSNECGESFSPKIKIQVKNCTTLPTITDPTVDQTPKVEKGGTLELKVEANGQGETPTYQWITSPYGVDIWNPVENATAATYLVPTGTKGPYYYRCEVTNNCGTRTSARYEVTVHPCTAAPSIEAATKYEYEVNMGASQTLHVSANGHEESVTYLWKASTSIGGPYTNASGQGYNEATYYVPTTTAATTYYQCEVKNSCDITTSGVYTVKVHPCTAAPTISSPTADQTPANQVVGATYTMSVTAIVSGATSTTYQWQRSTTGGTADTEWSDVDEARSSSYKAPTASTDLGINYYQCKVTTDCGTVVSKKWKITVVACSGTPTISSPATDETKVSKVGASAALSIIADGKGATPTYQWWRSTNQTAWTLIGGATNSAYTIPVVEAGPVYYRCVVTTGCGQVTSKIFTVNVCETGVEDAEGNWYCTGNFGDAGIWMTQNLRSTKTSDGSTTLTANINSDNSNTAYYYYPEANQATFDAHPEYGLLYTWAAANIGTSATENNNAFPGVVSTRQGICPDGWHLPSDYEWGLLEKEIASNPANYSSQTTAYTDAESYDYTAHSQWIPGESSTETTYWGRQMKSQRPVNGTEPGGSSNGCWARGLDVLLVGTMSSGEARGYGTTAAAWTASSYKDELAWTRRWSGAQTGTYRLMAVKYDMRSVRCKKNDN